MKTNAIRCLFAALAGLTAATLMTGCASVDVSNKGADMVVVQNSGCFLLGCIPLFSGDPDYPNKQVCNWFSNTVKLETNMRLLREEAENQGASAVRNVASHMDSESILLFLLKRKIYKTSAELVR